MSDGSDANSGGDVYVVNGSDDSESGYSSDSLNSLEVSPVVDFFVDVNTQETVTANWLRSPRVLYSQLRTTGTMMMVVVVVVLALVVVVVVTTMVVVVVVVTTMVVVVVVTTMVVVLSLIHI